jgi:hypothetical protein
MKVILNSDVRRNGELVARRGDVGFCVQNNENDARVLVRLASGLSSGFCVYVSLMSLSVPRESLI